MRCRLLNDALVTNPLYSELEERFAIDSGGSYDTPRQLAVSAGYVIDHPDAWVHCCPGVMNAKPIAEPADDECSAKVRIWMEEKRPAALKQIASQLEQLDTLKDPADRRRLTELARAYGLLQPGP